LTSAVAKVESWRVVVIDDSADDRAEFRRLLLRGSERRYVFAEAETGATGIAAVLAAGVLPDCVLLDYNLPDMEAPDILTALIDADGLLVCPVLVLTGGAAAEAGRLVLRAGAQDYISKAGLTPLGLTRAVENAVERMVVARDLRIRDVALRRSQRALQTLADNTPYILTRFGRDLRYVFVNLAAQKAIGRRRRAFLGKTNRELALPSRLCELWDKSLLRVFAEGVPLSIEFPYESEAGIRHFSSQLVPEFGFDNQVEYVLGVTHDVTDRIVYEKALFEADRRKDEFIATLAHELRNPLSPILTGLQILRLTLKPQGPHPTLDMMDRQLGQMTRLIDDLLDVSRITSDKVLLRLERVSLSSVVESAVETVWPVMDTRHHTFVLDLPDEPIWLDADPTRLAQVVGNLLNNAAKYSPDASRVSLTARREGDRAVIRITDTGHGIPFAMLIRVFEMFTQVRETPDRTQGGLGIGLALVKRLVEMHHGNVVAESAGAGRGSTFTVRLPIAVSPLALAKPHEPAVERTLFHGRRVLVVDDNVDGATSLAAMLALSGHEVRTAFCGQEALAIAGEFDPDVIFLDIGLPDMTGYEVVRLLHAEPVRGNALLVAVTGWGSEEDRRRSKDAGFHVHLTKPVAPAVFADLIVRSAALKEEGLLQGNLPGLR
jgi:signal transduction histidine kinase